MQIFPESAVFRKNARLRKVKITSSAANDLNFTHSVLHWLNRRKMAPDCAKMDCMGLAVAQQCCQNNRLFRQTHTSSSKSPSVRPSYLKLCMRAEPMPIEQKNRIAKCAGRFLAIQVDKTLMYSWYHFFGSKFTKMSIISTSWTVASCSKCTKRQNLVSYV